jgi:hypothetical protein
MTALTWFHGLFCDAANISDCHPVVVSLVNYELEIIWKAALLVSWRLLYQNMSVVSYENHVKSVDSCGLFKIWIGHVLNAKQKC